MDLLMQADQPQEQYSSETTQVVAQSWRYRTRGPRKGLRSEISQPDNPFIRHIPLTKGMYAVVDTHLYEWLMQWNWHARWTERGQRFYAGRGALNYEPEPNVVFMHKQIMGIRVGDPLEGDHVDRNSLNNTGQNLRHATPFENHLNTGIGRANTSGYKGVSWCKRERMWIVRVRTERGRLYVGRFPEDRKVDAARAYDAKARELHGKFAVLNFPNEVAS